MGYFTKIPLTATAAQLGPSDWSVRTTPQKYSAFGMFDQTQIIPRGKGLGGSGQMNFLMHGFGRPEDYERWARLGFKGWTADDLKPYFIKAFGTVRSEFDSEHCSLDGVCPGSESPMKLKLIDEHDVLMRTFREASRKLSDKHTLFRKPTATIRHGMRYGTLDAYLKPALKRKNLHVLLNTKAISIRFENNTASSLYILKNHRDLDNVFVDKEIILSSGAIMTPQLLIQSGIGPRKLIQRLRIKPVVSNERVGENLHDHMNIPVYVSIKKPISLTLAKLFSFSTFWDYFWRNQGLLSYPPIAGIEYQNSSALILFSMGTASETLLREISNYKHKVFRSTFVFHNDTRREGFMFLATCAQPRTRGSIKVADTSSSTPPVVDPNYLHNGHDVRCIIKAMRRAEQLVSSGPFQDIGARIHWPRPERCLSLWSYSRQDWTGSLRRNKIKGKTSQEPQRTPRPSQPPSPPDEYLECIVRELAVPGHHVGGTCAGGSVVDDQLRVKEVSNLRVMDASVLPSPVSLFPNSPLVSMAEKAADLIKNSI
ncbi:neither inactivation nor afterpotential protein G isoform X2 [Plodia interpunctella]|nr:neither inactivation nor afterpotential protein G isoform X2 [Plodia interpunctella]